MDDPRITLVISGNKEPYNIFGGILCNDVWQAFRSLSKVTNEMLVPSEGLYPNWISVDEFAVTFFDWIRVQQVALRAGMVRDKVVRNCIADFLSKDCYGKTIMYIDKGVTEEQYTMYQMMVNIMHLGISYWDAKNMTQKKMGLTIHTNIDDHLSKQN